MNIVEQMTLERFEKWVKSIEETNAMPPRTAISIPLSTKEARQLISDVQSIISQQSAEIERLREAIKEAKDKEWELAGETTPVFMILHLALSEVEGESHETQTPNT